VLLQLTLQTELKRGVMHLNISASDIISPFVWLSIIRCWVYCYILVIGQRSSYRHGGSMLQQTIVLLMTLYWMQLSQN